MTDDLWAEQGQKAHLGLDPLRFLIGEWRGVGHTHGAEAQGRMTVEPVLDGTWLRATEHITDVNSGAETMDLSFYRYNVEAESLQIFQLYEHAHLSTLLVEPTASGFRWITGPLAPQLAFERTKDGFQYCASVDGNDAPLSQMSYKPA
jgi:hypothetical protein